MDDVEKLAREALKDSGCIAGFEYGAAGQPVIVDPVAVLAAIKSAILAERERCARVADAHAALCSDRTRIEVLYAEAASHQIATAIRNAPPTP